MESRRPFGLDVQTSKVSKALTLNVSVSSLTATILFFFNKPVQLTGFCALPFNAHEIVTEVKSFVPKFSRYAIISCLPAHITVGIVAIPASFDTLLNKKPARNALSDAVV